MYSYEINQIMEQSNYNIDSNTYMSIIQASPQINHVIYRPYGSYYEMWSGDGDYWKFTVYKGGDLCDD